MPQHHLIHHISGQSFRLLPEKAFIWEETATLILADLHLGKITHFRKAGIGLPHQAEQENLAQLSHLILNEQVDRVMILGDLFHSHINEQWPIFKDFLKKFAPLPFVLVKGNHDILHKSAYAADNLTIYPDTLEEGPFCFSHHPQKDAERYNIHGHIHPSVLLRGAGLQSLKLPCFHFGAQHLVVPAFGVFTGTAKIEPKKEDSIYVITEEKVILVE
jgi:DNA ligase-associated metallophosphoesterase